MSPYSESDLLCPYLARSCQQLRREIALIGDTMNTAARIIEACRDTDNRVLASAALIERLATLPPGVTRRRLGEFPVRGKERRLELDVLEA
jgi:adenylate cyclase